MEKGDLAYSKDTLRAGYKQERAIDKILKVIDKVEFS